MSLEKLIAKAGAAPVTTGPVEFSSTGLIGLDWALGGGIARGRLIEFYGLESSGKSTIGLQAAIREALVSGRPALWLDYEYAWEPTYVEGLIAADPDSRPAGASIDSLFHVAQPQSIEKGFELAGSAIEGGYVSSVWFDSTGVMESEMSGIGTRARAMAERLPALIRQVASGGVVCGFISQTREVIQTGFGASFSQGPTKKATGGTAIKFAFSQRVEFTHKARLKGKAESLTGSVEEAVIGRRVIAKVMKNKVGHPFRQMEFDLVDGVGFDPVRHLIEVGVEVGVVEKKGAFFSVEGLPKPVQGVQNLAGVLRDPRGAGVLDGLERAVTTKLEAVGGVSEADTEIDEGGVGDDETVDEG